MAEKTKQLTVRGVDLLKNGDGELTGEVKAVIAELDQIDLDGDILAPGSIGKQDVTVSAYNHGSWMASGEPALFPIGKGVVREAVNQHGKRMLFEGKLFTDMTAASETLKLLKNMGDAQEWSFSLHQVKGERVERDGRDAFLIKDVTVHEVSPVLKGASVGSRTISVKKDQQAVDNSRNDTDNARNTSEEVEETMGDEDKTLTSDNIQPALEAALKNALPGLAGGSDEEGDQQVDVASLATAIVPVFTKSIGEVLAERDKAAADAEAARKQAEADKAQRDAEQAKEDQARKEREEAIKKQAYDRAMLESSAAPMLPDDFDATKATDREILEAAMKPVIGDRSKTASDEYLRAYMDLELDRRKANPNRREAPGFLRSGTGDGRGSSEPYVQAPDFSKKEGVQLPQVRSEKLDEARADFKDYMRSAWQTRRGESREAFQSRRDDAAQARKNRINKEGN